MIELPVIPEDLGLTSPFNDEGYESMNQELNLIGTRKLREIDLSSFFPIRDYPFLRSRKLWGMGYVRTIERWRDKRLPIRIIIANDNSNGFSLNMAATIPTFTYETGKSGDIDYKLSLKEFVFVKVSG